MTDKAKPVVAAFDFDGTITTKDVMVPFLEYVEGRVTTWSKLATLTPAFLGFITGLVSRQSVKEAIIAKFFGGSSEDLMQLYGDSFAGSNALSRLVRPEAMERIAWHREQGHRLVLVSAGICPYIAPWGFSHGFNDILCSQLEFGKDNEVTGKLLGKNCWGIEKVRRLEALLGPREGYVLYAYGNSRGDKEMLEYADYPAYKKLIH